MNKKASKIRLHRETLRNLEESLGAVAGGLTFTCVANGCEWTGKKTCATANCISDLC